MRKNARGGRATNNAALRANIIGEQSNSVRRLQKDLKELREADVPLFGVTACPLDNSIFKWHGNLRGPEGSAFKGGVFHVSIEFPQNYPVSPPDVKLFTEIPHPNVFGKTICLDMLQKAKPEAGQFFQGWTSAYSVEGILCQLQSFLFEAPKAFRRDLLPENNQSAMSAPRGDWQDPRDWQEPFKKAVEDANAFRCAECSHRGPIEPYPKFHEKDAEADAYVILRSEKEMLRDEFLCYHSRTRLAEQSLGIGISISRLPRTGEIREVTPTLDLLCLRAYTKQKVRMSASNERFTHWFPLFFGEREKYERKTQVLDKELEEYVTKVEQIDPYERFNKLVHNALSYVTTGSTKKPFEPKMVLEVLPKLIITHLVNLVDLKLCISIKAIRRLVNFLRLFRWLMKEHPEIEKTVDEQLEKFIKSPELRIKDHFASLGDLLSFATISNKFKFEDLKGSYLEEQLDRQAFWIIRSIPEIDHTDKKNKGKAMIMEQHRNETCFKTGVTGFHMTLTVNIINECIANDFNNDLNAMDATLDDNYGCLPREIEDRLLHELKSMKKVDNFNDYYTRLGQNVPDDEAISARLKQAITNSKDKKYHGSSEHMNELIDLDEQSKELLLAEPSPFLHFDKEKKVFANKNDAEWKTACCEKFPWVDSIISSNWKEVSPAELGQQADDRSIKKTIVAPKDQDKLKWVHNANNKASHEVKAVMAQGSEDDYPENYSWKLLFHKLCFEQMLDYFGKTLDFKLFYDYINWLGDYVPVLRVNMVKKTHLKSNNYWIMALIGKMPALQVIKFHNRQQIAFAQDGWKYLSKGLNFSQQNGKAAIRKLQFNEIITQGYASEYIYSSLKSCPDILCLTLNNQVLQTLDTKAIGKILSDFKRIKELDISNCQLQASTAQDIADGLMRAKSLEIIKLADNPSIGKGLYSILYNLAFSPKIKFIDCSNCIVDSAETGEALYKLISISGAIETLNLSKTNVFAYLTEQFWKAVGESKTLQYLNLDSNSRPTAQTAFLGKAIAMNAYKNGSLQSVSMQNWINGYAYFNMFFNSMYLSEKDHEVWYGDAKTAKLMEKEQLVRKFYCKLDFLDMQSSHVMAGDSFRFKTSNKLKNPNWPAFLHFAKHCKTAINISDSRWTGAMDLMVHAIGENPVGTCKLTTLDLSRNQFKKEGAKQLGAAIALNKSIVTLDLSSCKMGVSGMYAICDALKTNTTLRNLNVYRNTFDVDGARALGEVLKVNSTITDLDIGHNRIRQTGLTAVVDGILANKNSKVKTLAVRANFISDDSFTDLFEKLVFAGAKHQVSHLFIKANFLSEFHKIALATKAREQGSKLFVDAFEGVKNLQKVNLDKSIWVSPMPASYVRFDNLVEDFFTNTHECGLITDVRIRSGKQAPGRNQANWYAIVEFAHENSVPRSMKLASKKLVSFSGQKARIYKTGTRTAIIMPNQRRKK